MIGLLIGWSWRPRWTGLVYLGLRSKLRFLWTAPPRFGARRVWLALTALSAFSVCRTLWSRFGSSGKKSATPASVKEILPCGETEAISRLGDKNTEKEQEIMTEKDLEHLLHLLEDGNTNMEWQSMMDKSTPNMSYKAWRHEPESSPGLGYETQHCHNSCSRNHVSTRQGQAASGALGHLSKQRAFVRGVWNSSNGCWSLKERRVLCTHKLLRIHQEGEAWCYSSVFYVQSLCNENITMDDRFDQLYRQK